jgi:hypothetical protein
LGGFQCLNVHGLVLSTQLLHPGERVYDDASMNKNGEHLPNKK